MKKLALSFALTLLTSVAASAAEKTETIDRTFDVRPGTRLKLSNVNGRITIGSWDQPRVRVVAVKRAKGDGDDVARYLKEMKVEMAQTAGGLSVTTTQPKRDDFGIFDWLMGDHVNGQVTYDLTVPRTMNIDVSNTNGTISVRDITGAFELDTTNGKIECERCAGSMEASTTNGAIDAELVRIAKGQPFRFETTNGRISIALPKDAAMDVDAGTTNGSISSDLPMTTQEKDRNTLRGTINGGGTRLRARTTNGGISITTL